MVDLEHHLSYKVLYSINKIFQNLELLCLKTLFVDQFLLFFHFYKLMFPIFADKL